MAFYSLFDNSRVSTEQEEAALKNSQEAVRKIARKGKMKKIHCRECQQPICEHIQKWQKEAVDKLSRRNMQIRDLKNTIKILGERLNAIRDTFYDTKQNPQVFAGNVETILNATKNKL